MFHSQKKILIFLLLLMIASLSGCAGLSDSSSANRLQQSEDAYKSALRWGEWATLFQLQKNKPNSKQASFEPISTKYLEYLTHIKIPQITILSSAMDSNEQSAKTVFLIEYHYDDSTKIKKIHHTVNWWYHEDNNYWYTNTLLPEEFQIKESKTIKLSP